MFLHERRFAEIPTLSHFIDKVGDNANLCYQQKTNLIHYLLKIKQTNTR